MHKQLYTIGELASILGFSVSAVHAHLARKNYEAVPPPFRLGRRLMWSAEEVNKWLDEKIEKARNEIEKQR